MRTRPRIGRLAALGNRQGRETGALESLIESHWILCSGWSGPEPSQLWPNLLMRPREDGCTMNARQKQRINFDRLPQHLQSYLSPKLRKASKTELTKPVSINPSGIYEGDAIELLP